MRNFLCPGWRRGGLSPNFVAKGHPRRPCRLSTAGTTESNEAVSVVLPQGWNPGSGYSQTTLTLDGPNEIYVQLYGDVFRASGYSLPKYFAYRLTQFRQDDPAARLCGNQSSIELAGTSIPGDGKSISICYAITSSDDEMIPIQLTQRAALFTIDLGTFKDQALLTVGIGYPTSISPAYVNAAVRPILDSIHWAAASQLG